MNVSDVIKNRAFIYFDYNNAIVTNTAVSMVDKNYFIIPDTNFAKYLNEIIPLAMKGNKLDTTSNLVKTLTTINARNRGIKDLTGISNFINLTDLNIGNDKETPIKSKNKISFLPYIPHKIINLNCENIELIYISFIPPYLETLICNNNNISDLRDLNKRIKKINCSYNNIFFIENYPDSLVELDISYNSMHSLGYLREKLEVLKCSNNKLTQLENLPITLKYLDASNNLITCFSEFPRNKYTNLNIKNNPNTCLPNYAQGMDSLTLTYPICSENDSINNPFNCYALTKETSSIKEENDIQLILYPNPTENHLTFERTNSTINFVTISIVSVNGQVLTTNKLDLTNKHTIDISNYTPGVYFVYLQNEKSSNVIKVVKK
jgi:hypothetical protein